MTCLGHELCYICYRHPHSTLCRSLIPSKNNNSSNMPFNGLHRGISTVEGKLAFLQLQIFKKDFDVSRL